MLSSLVSYSRFVYTIPDRFHSVKRSTLILKPMGVAVGDPQPHPDDPMLASTHPHHKHVSPDIKHNRIPAPGLTFDQPNFPFLIREIEETLLRFTEEPPVASSPATME